MVGCSSFRRLPICKVRSRILWICKTSQMQKSAAHQIYSCCRVSKCFMWSKVKISDIQLLPGNIWYHNQNCHFHPNRGQETRMTSSLTCAIWLTLLPRWTSSLTTSINTHLMSSNSGLWWLSWRWWDKVQAWQHQQQHKQKFQLNS